MGNGGRKRGYNDRESAEPGVQRDSHYGDRAQKQLRRGGQRGGAYNGRYEQPKNFDQPMHGGFSGANQFPDMSTMTSPPPGFPPLDPNNPMAAIMAMQAMGFPAMPGFPSFPGAGPSASGDRKSSESMVPKKVGQRCRDYDTKGFCAAGSMCPYEHGIDFTIAPGANDGKHKPIAQDDCSDKHRIRPTTGFTPRQLHFIPHKHTRPQSTTIRKPPALARRPWRQRQPKWRRHGTKPSRPRHILLRRPQ